MLTDRSAEGVFSSGLHEFLDEFLAGIAAFHDSLQSDYFESYLGTEECVI
jgi:hypothetical protein